MERRIPFADVVKNGSLGVVQFDSSGWFLVRAVTDNPRTFRFASTGPYYVEICATKRRISRTSAQFFLDWTRERVGRIKLPEGEQRRRGRGLSPVGREILARETSGGKYGTMK